ncbi:MAG: hypothetical protein LBM03_00975 [Erysipelotrichaceae bacterium]|jgi:dihydrofolate synthase/folylpolyglutamate synthase|nr:hypothetical protein [Erysipelotrichaceae bacterium]
MINTNEELLKYLLSLRTGDYQLDNFEEFLKEINFTFNKPAIHISGTNGKGTVGTVLKNIYQEAGYKVGYFHSPYLYNPDEMIIYNNEQISLKEIDEIISGYNGLISKYNLSEFEVETFIALYYFEKMNVDLAVIECGLGGLYDATNVITPILSIITSISMEHTALLGNSLTEIARHKAGIIKKGIPVLIGELEEDALEVIKEVAAEHHSKIFTTSQYLFEELEDDGYKFTYKPYNDLKIHSLALFSILDASIALEAVSILQEYFKVLEDSVRAAIAKTRLIGRMEIVHESPLVICDGAHNPAATHELKESIEKMRKEAQIHVIFAAFKDKNIERMFAELNFISNDITLTTFDHLRARKEEEYFLFLGEFRFDDNYKKVISDKMKEFPNDIILATGSLAFAAKVSKEFKDGDIK